MEELPATWSVLFVGSEFLLTHVVTVTSNFVIRQQVALHSKRRIDLQSSSLLTCAGAGVGVC